MLTLLSAALVLSAAMVNLAAPHHRLCSQELCAGVLAGINPALLEAGGFLRSLVTVSVILKGLHSKPHESAGTFQLPSVGLDQTCPALSS